MGGDDSARWSGVTATLAALVAGMVAFIGFVLDEQGAGRPLISVTVVATGFGVYFGLRGPLGGRVARGIGSGYVVFGAQLAGTALLVDLPPSDGVLIALLGYGVPAVAAVGFALLGVRVWAAGAGIAVPSAVALVLQVLGGLPELFMLVLAVLLTALVVLLPARTRLGVFAGAAAATCALHASGSGLLMFVLVGWVPTPELAPFDAAVPGVRFGAVLVAALLVMLAAVRREPAAGLVAAVVLALATPVAGRPFVWLPLVALVLALVALRVPAVRLALARIPVASRGRGEADTAAGCAVVAGGALVMFAWHGLPELDATPTLTGLATLLALAISGALAHFLPTRAGTALAVVTLVVLLLGRPWKLLFGGDDGRVDGAVAVLGLAVAVAASWVLIQRHNRPAVWGAAAYLMLGSLSDVIAPLLGLGPVDASAGHVVTLLLPLVLVGATAMVLSTWHRALRRWQAVAAVAVGSMIAIPAYVTLSAAAPEGGSLGLVVNPLVPSDTWASTALLDDSGVGAVFVSIVVLALGSVVSVGRRPAAHIGVTATLVVYTTMPPALARMSSADADIGAFLLFLFVAVVALVVATWFAARRHASAARLVHRA